MAPGPQRDWSVVMSTAVLAPSATKIASLDVTDRHALEPVACLNCGSDRARFFLSGVDDLTGRPGRFTFVQCLDCHLVYQAPRLTPSHIRSYYDDEYIAHQAHARWGLLAPLFRAAMGSLDRAKLGIAGRHMTLDRSSAVLDVGCGAGSFIDKVRRDTAAGVAAVDLVDLSDRPALRGVEFHPGPFYDQNVGQDRFDLVTMWHFLEHDYDPLRSLVHARNALRPGGVLIVEVPRLDSLSFRIFKTRWPGIQAPQHTALYDRARLLQIVTKAGFEVVEHLPYGAFPPYFYLFCGVAFTLLRGRGLNLGRAIYAYFAGQMLCLPILPFLNHMNFAMQTVICRRPMGQKAEPCDR
jgi:2-polyprenyl-3-methyl-5-hydroxy-6-metoxy-1,4-benzoquinol methylase